MAAGRRPGHAAPESIWSDPYPDEQPGSRTACRARGALRAARERRARLHRRAPAPARAQRAVLILREVLGLSAREVAQSLDNDGRVGEQRASRARKTSARRVPARSQQRQLRSLGYEASAGWSSATSPRGRAGTSTRWCRCSSKTRPSRCRPFPCWFSGRTTWSRFMSRGRRRFANVLRAGGASGIAWYIPRPARAPPAGVDRVLALEGDRVKEITAFRRPGSFFRGSGCRPSCGRGRMLGALDWLGMTIS